MKLGLLPSYHEIGILTMKLRPELIQEKQSIAPSHFHVQSDMCESLLQNIGLFCRALLQKRPVFYV